MINHNLAPARPDYNGGSIVNLMTSLAARFGAASDPCYPQLACLDADRLGRAKRVALVVIDGLGDELLSHFGALDGASNALTGCKVGTMTSVYPPTTASAVTSYMSGQAPQQHGLTGWFMHFRKLGAVTAVLPFMPRYARAPLAANGIDPGQLIDAASFAETLAVPSAALLPHDLVDSDFSRLLARGARRDSYKDLSTFSAALQKFARGLDDAQYLYAYWPKLDHLSHIHGPSSDTVAAHYLELDRALAGLMDLAAAHDTLVIITADHGFIDSGAAERIDLGDHPDLSAMLTLPLCGEPRSGYAYVRRQSLDAFERYMSSEFAGMIDVHSSEAMIDAGWFGLGRPHDELAARLGDYVLCMRERYTLRDSVIGERDFALAGVHGGMSAAEQIVPLLIAGP